MKKRLRCAKLIKFIVNVYLQTFYIENYKYQDPEFPTREDIILEDRDAEDESDYVDCTPADDGVINFFACLYSIVPAISIGNSTSVHRPVTLIEMLILIVCMK